MSGGGTKDVWRLSFRHGGVRFELEGQWDRATEQRVDEPGCEHTEDFAERVGQLIAALVDFRGYADSLPGHSWAVAAEEVVAMLMGVHPRLSELGLEIFDDVGGSSLASKTLRRQDCSTAREATIFGEAQILCERPEAGLYLLHIDAGKSIPRHHHRVMRELEWWVSGELERDGERLIGPQPVEWPRGRVHSYRNIGEERATVFCCDMPAFIREDEIYESELRSQGEAKPDRQFKAESR